MYNRRLQYNIIQCNACTINRKTNKKTRVLLLQRYNYRKRLYESRLLHRHSAHCLGKSKLLTTSRSDEHASSSLHKKATKLFLSLLTTLHEGSDHGSFPPRALELSACDVKCENKTFGRQTFFFFFVSGGRSLARANRRLPTGLEHGLVPMGAVKRKRGGKKPWIMTLERLAFRGSGKPLSEVLGEAGAEVSGGEEEDAWTRREEDAGRTLQKRETEKVTSVLFLGVIGRGGEEGGVAQDPPTA